MASVHRIWPTVAKQMRGRLVANFMMTVEPKLQLLQLNRSFRRFNTHMKSFSDSSVSGQSSRQSCSQMTNAKTNAGHLEVHWADGTNDRFSYVWLRGGYLLLVTMADFSCTFPDYHRLDDGQIYSHLILTLRRCRFFDFYCRSLSGQRQF